MNEPGVICRECLQTPESGEDQCFDGKAHQLIEQDVVVGLVTATTFDLWESAEIKDFLSGCGWDFESWVVARRLTRDEVKRIVAGEAELTIEVRRVKA